MDWDFLALPREVRVKVCEGQKRRFARQMMAIVRSASYIRDVTEPIVTLSPPHHVPRWSPAMKTIQRIESGICVAISVMLAGGWVAAVGLLFGA